MSRKSLLCLAVAVTAASIQLSGCGKVPSQTPAPTRMTAPADARVAQNPGDDLRRQHQEMLAALNLTDQQTAQIRSIVARHKAEMRGQGELRTQLEQLRTLVLAETVDKAALVQAITAMHESKLAKLPHLTAMVGEIRGVLTPEQRSTAVTQLNERWDDLISAMDTLRTDGFAQLSNNLNLNSEQSAALAALQEEDRTLDNAVLADVRAAMTQFLTGGDQEALTTSLQTALATSRMTDIIDNTADWVVSLDQTQRQQLVANTAAYLQKLKAMHRAMHADLGGMDSDDED